MNDFAELIAQLNERGASDWATQLPEQLATAFACNTHGESAKWQQLLEQLPTTPPSHIDLNQDAVHIGLDTDLSTTQKAALYTTLQGFHPWRKGPYNIFGHQIDTEWRSDWKWQRILPHIAPLQYRNVLDVGCGNGYHCWRMLGAGAKWVLGIDPLMLNVKQFHVIKQLHGPAPVEVLPFNLEALPADLKLFDTVFSMGVLYHRRSPIDHLLELRDCLTPGGELVLETLIIDGQLGEALFPEDRYARMRNVWFIPTPATLNSWLQRCGFKNCRLVDTNRTSTDEQRSTEWMRFHSLKDFLDPNNPQLTCEGMPAPLRGVFIANR